MSKQTYSTIFKDHFKGKRVVVIGAAQGIGATIGEALAGSGAEVLLADLSEAVHDVAERIRAAGHEAESMIADVVQDKDVAQIFDRARDKWGALDVLVNNAGILRDRSFAKMDLADFRQVLDVHLMGAVHTTKAVWPIMQAQKYGRLIMTTSSTGLYGNFGQTNYGAAKLALVGFMQTLGLEGAKYDIRVNCLAPTAATRMTEGLLPQEALDALQPAAIVPAMLVLACPQAPNRTILCAGGGSFEAAHITLTSGVHFGVADDTPERLLAALDRVTDRRGEIVPENGGQQGQVELRKALAMPA